LNLRPVFRAPGMGTGGSPLLSRPQRGKKAQGREGDRPVREVWRARDTRLGRDVAIKVLPEALALEPERPGPVRAF